MTLTDQQIDQFQADGYLVLPAVFDNDEVRAMRRDADFILELVINSSLFNKRKSGRLDFCTSEDGGHMVRKIQPINDLSLALSAASEDERLIGPMRQLMGDNPILMEEKLNYKQPLPTTVPDLEPNNRTSSFPIHNDWAYYAAQEYPQTIISSAISLDACTETSGPLRIWPGTHTHHLEHQRVEIGLEVKPGLVDPDGGEAVLAPAGSVMLFHALLVHNSCPNASGGPRRLMIYSHFPKAADMGHDARNGRGRLRESPYEWAYQRAKTAGHFTDRFSAPVTEG